jgi:hypothetical protein
LVGYESILVGARLTLESQKLIERSQSCRGVHLYRVINSKDVEHQRCLQELVSLSESRAGQFELVKQLSPVLSGTVSGEAVHSPSLANTGEKHKGVEG